MFFVFLFEQALLHPCFHIIVQEIESLHCTSLLGGEIKVVVTIMLVLSLGCPAELINAASIRRFGHFGDFTDVFFDAGPTIKRYIHHVQGRLALLLLCSKGVHAFLCRIHVAWIYHSLGPTDRREDVCSCRLIWTSCV